MKPEVMAEIIDCHATLDQLESEGRFAEAEQFLAENLWILNYDHKGNWIGHVANENGWTA